MRPYILALFSVVLVVDMPHAQYFPNQKGFAASKTFYDYNTLRHRDFAAFRDYQDGFEISYFHNIGRWVSLRFPFGAGIYRDSVSEGLKVPFYNFGAQAQLHLHRTVDKPAINPYLALGLNALIPHETSLAIQLPVGIGVHARLHPQLYINWQSDFRFSVANWENHLQHQIGFLYLLGGAKIKDYGKPEPKAQMDSDGDGIPDALDLCPSIAGLAKFSGCPDSDNDGIEDQKDKCPQLAGPGELMGCPDSDGDGVSDNDDECPNLKGLKDNKGCPEKDSDGDGIPDARDLCPDKAGLPKFSGCPDSDGDGISDKDDKCPNIPGVASRNGCPEESKKDADNDGIEDEKDECPFSAGLAQFKGCPDTDGDGVQDKLDDCPSIPGPISNKGCPVIDKKDRETLDFAMRAVQFDLGRATLKEESFAILDRIGGILKKYPDYNLAIGGHTDNTGSNVFNLELSEKRAKVCYEYLILKGISPNRLSYAGYGSTKPISDNRTEIGRYLNRRVEFNLVPRN